jgi:hypothetical protein
MWRGNVVAGCNEISVTKRSYIEQCLIDLNVAELCSIVKNTLCCFSYSLCCRSFVVYLTTLTQYYVASNENMIGDNEF